MNGGMIARRGIVRPGIVGAILACLALPALPMVLPARALAMTTWQVDCSAGTITSTGAVNVSLAGFNDTYVLGALLGTPTIPATVSPAPVSGDTVEIIGQCVEDVTISTSNLMLTNHNGPDAPLNTSDAAQGLIEGQVEIAGARGIVINGLVLGKNGGSSLSFASAGDQALLYAHDGAVATLQNSYVQGSPDIGVLSAGSSALTLLNVLVAYNGLNNSDGSSNSGIEAINNSKVVLGAFGSTQTGSSAVSLNGGDGIDVLQGSSVLVQAASIDQNPNRQIYVAGSSSAYLAGSAATVNIQSCAMSPCGNAVEARGSSTI